jgi:hypothetical protein
MKESLKTHKYDTSTEGTFGEQFPLMFAGLADIEMHAQIQTENTGDQTH